MLRGRFDMPGCGRGHAQFDDDSVPQIVGSGAVVNACRVLSIAGRLIGFAQIALLGRCGRRWRSPWRWINRAAKQATCKQARDEAQAKRPTSQHGGYARKGGGERQGHALRACVDRGKLPWPARSFKLWPTNR